MKKIILALMLIVAPAFCIAEPNLDEARVVRVELLLYPDLHRGTDLAEWHEVVQQISEIMNHREEGSQWTEKLYNLFASTITKSHEKHIHGRLHVQMGNGQCVKGVCAEDCACLKKYSGVCPCGLEDSKRCCSAE